MPSRWTALGGAARRLLHWLRMTSCQIASLIRKLLPPLLVQQGVRLQATSVSRTRRSRPTPRPADRAVHCKVGHVRQAVAMSRDLMRRPYLPPPTDHLPACLLPASFCIRTLDHPASILLPNLKLYSCFSCSRHVGACGNRGGRLECRGGPASGSSRGAWRRFRRFWISTLCYPYPHAGPASIHGGDYILPHGILWRWAGPGGGSVAAKGECRTAIPLVQIASGLQWGKGEKAQIWPVAA